MEQSLLVLLNVLLRPFIAPDSRDIFSSKCAQRYSVDYSIIADINFIHYEYENSNAYGTIWIPLSANLNDPCTKKD